MMVKYMKVNALEILEEIEKHGYEAYIVGGFVRDYCLNQATLDIDVCTSATPKELSLIFKGAIVPTETYGAVTLIYKKVRYEITTFRKDIKYDDYRRPSQIEYVDNLMEDLKRRDFTINTLCMNSKGEVIDLLNAKEDLDRKVIKTVGDAKDSLKEDVLRILRAIRFATTLNFKLSDEVKEAIIDNKRFLSELSYARKKEELTKIFSNPNAKYGISLLNSLELAEALELSNLINLKIIDDILGVWAQLDVLDIYPFTKVERETITKIKEALAEPEITNYSLYKYGLYIMSIVSSIKGLDKKRLTKKYESLPIKIRGEINLDVNQICKRYNIKPDYWIKDVYQLLEQEIANGTLNNNQNDITEYIHAHLNKD